MTTTRIEAESMNLSGAYGVSNFGISSGGQAISLPRGQPTSGKTGQASFTFTGVAGSYNLDVGHYKERDGGATIDVAVNGVSQGKVEIFSRGADASPTTGSFAEETFPVALKPDDVVTLTAKGSNWSHAVVDYVELTDTANIPPVADDDSATTDEDTAVRVDVLDGDSDSDGGTLTVASVDTTATVGVVTNNGSDVTYDPNGRFEHLADGESATDLFSYTVADGQGGSDTATVTMTVTGADDGPLPTTMRIEAEDMNLSGAYGVSSFGISSGGQAISLPRGQATSGKTGQASFTFTGVAGSYDLDVGHYKERDGGATIDVAVNGVSQGKVKIFSRGADASPTTASFAEETFPVALKPGDVVTLTAKGSNWSHAVVDYVDLTATEPISIFLDDLDGTNGFRVSGTDTRDGLGAAVSGTHDFNGDGFGDVVVGASGVDVNGTSDEGATYVMFGGPGGFEANLSVASLDGSNGFRIEGIDDGDESGFSVSGSGDVNGDGRSDLVIGAPGAFFEFPGGSVPAGESYVVYGASNGFGPNFDLSALDGSNGFLFDEGGSILQGDDFGSSVSGAGDVNGDGLAETIVGHPMAVREGFPGSGESHLIFGALDGVVDTVVFGGVGQGEASGSSVSNAGDVNSDGLADIIIGAPGANEGRGESYVVFGSADGFDPQFDFATLDGTNGFRLSGGGVGRVGHSVSGAGDMNGDGFGDLIIGAPGGRAGDLMPDEARAYVVFGSADGFGDSFDLASIDGSNGFLLEGLRQVDEFGEAVSDAGDVNADGFDDIIVGAAGANPIGAGGGSSYVIFGQANGSPERINLADLDPTIGLRLDGIDAGDRSGASVSGAGDVNGDGFHDMLVGAPGADVDGETGAGESYVVFGRDFGGIVTHQGTVDADVLTGTPGADVMIGGQGNDTMLGNGGADVQIGAEGDDLLAVSDFAFQRLIGGTGLDTLRLDGNNLILDLPSIPDTKIQGLEQFDLNGGSNQLVLNKLELANISDLANELNVLGDTSNAVLADLSGLGFSESAADGFTEYTDGILTLRIEDGIDQSGVLIA